MGHPHGWKYVAVITPLRPGESGSRYRELDVRRYERRRKWKPAEKAALLAAHSGDLERSIRSIMNTDSGDHEHPLALA